VTLTAPAEAMAATVASIEASVSVRPGRIGAISTPTGKPASVSCRIASSRRRGLGVPASTVRQSPSSTKPTEYDTPTRVTVAACRSNGRSRSSRVPLVRIENGLAKSRSAEMICGISW
jgi:hypothetical protein